ncbi:hypothetical protein Mal52_22440 [Symmachiella dynata]|uniref:Uncharacterized protein n=1 Tax=Symmachiella dynata TaxID=2527995 RepID=A0A517ZMR7_9PLAN|nr:hypothetical protein Mal52_22440 [Symmachiella dynata]
MTLKYFYDSHNNAGGPERFCFRGGEAAGDV